MSVETAVLQNNLGPSLRRWRVLNRVKQQALARDLGVSQSKVSRWESGAAEPEGADRLRITQLLRARPETAADRALLELVSNAAGPVHLVCDLTHRLLALSPARAREWHVPVADFLNRPLWRFATQSIRSNEYQLTEHGWFEPFGPDVCFRTERADFAEMTIPDSWIRISRLPLSDGSFARLVREEPHGPATAN
ncbi:helix-turn-helix domain-containing protein [Roseibium salinum]|uniref:Helix-turn-helix transcriptional regulator n=1 Tax=Roseibium salinum TaxID=1604349 RepID=A0ABT3R2H1_9HYPH|nr:helix-turn-helix transcriptional regulator [Roseibium sp. DSM 29163]MCX2723347.1 helix-turn-helix transcriptional regulator [Roseibium sp. DSM 29163]MDN3718756.1 helix-turn-helix transcriptional regulator [Roseibium salinum]